MSVEQIIRIYMYSKQFSQLGNSCSQESKLILKGQHNNNKKSIYIVVLFDSVWFYHHLKYAYWMYSYKVNENFYNFMKTVINCTIFDLKRNLNPFVYTKSRKCSSFCSRSICILIVSKCSEHKLYFTKGTEIFIEIPKHYAWQFRFFRL